MSDKVQGWTALHDMVVIEPRDAFATAGEIVLPEAYDDDAHGSDRDMIREYNKACLGIVRAVGPGMKNVRTEEDADDDEITERRKPDIEVGAQVLYDRASATRLDGTDPMLVIVPEGGIFMEVVGDVAPVVGGLVTRS